MLSQKKALTAPARTCPRKFSASETAERLIVRLSRRCASLSSTALRDSTTRSCSCLSFDGAGEISPGSSGPCSEDETPARGAADGPGPGGSSSCSGLAEAADRDRDAALP